MKFAPKGYVIGSKVQGTDVSDVQDCLVQALVGEVDYVLFLPITGGSLLPAYVIDRDQFNGDNRPGVVDILRQAIDTGILPYCTIEPMSDELVRKVIAE